MLEQIPLWGSFSVIGVLVGIIVTVIVLLFRGDLTTRKHLDQVFKISESWQKAWEVSEQTKQGQAEVLNKLLVGQDTMLRILESRPLDRVPNVTSSDEDKAGDSS